MYTSAVGAGRPTLEISEVVASNLNGLQDESGRHPDWIEIRNCSTQSVALAGIGLGRNLLGNSGRMVFSNGVTLAPGQHLVIYADDKPEIGPLHAQFKLDAAGDHVVLAGLTERGARYV